MRAFACLARVMFMLAVTSGPTAILGTPSKRLYRVQGYTILVSPRSWQTPATQVGISTPRSAGNIHHQDGYTHAAPVSTVAGKIEDDDLHASASTFGNRVNLEWQEQAR